MPQQGFLPKQWDTHVSPYFIPQRRTASMGERLWTIYLTIVLQLMRSLLSHWALTVHQALQSTLLSTTLSIAVSFIQREETEVKRQNLAYSPVLTSGEAGRTYNAGCLACVPIDRPGCIPSLQGWKQAHLPGGLSECHTGTCNSQRCRR